MLAGVPQFYIDTGFENGSASMGWEPVAEDVVDLVLQPEHERFAPNRHARHWHFRVHFSPHFAGRALTCRVRSFDNCWNGRVKPGLRERRVAVALAPAGGAWRTVLTTAMGDDPDFALTFEVPAEAPVMQVAKVHPYTTVDLARTLGKLRDGGQARVSVIGRSLDDRPLEVVELGDPDAPQRVFLRSRAHPWEPGGSWLVDGLIDRWLAPRPGSLDHILLQIMPMPGKDGVVRGLSRFNVCGIDPNRVWAPGCSFDSQLVPEAACLLDWLEGRRAAGRFPTLAIDIHNDANGQLHLCPAAIAPAGYHERMTLLQDLLRDHTWFSEGAAPPRFSNPGSFAQGIAEMYGIDAYTWELNAEWIAALDRPPVAADWQQLGAAFVDLLPEYLARAAATPA